jgi:small subunit ribosomal protein S19
MSRSLYKGVYVNDTIKQYLMCNSGEHLRELQTRDRSSTILPQLVGKQISVYNGKEYHKIQISSSMVGHKFGEFVSTRKRAVYKKKAVKKKSK